MKYLDFYKLTGKGYVNGWWTNFKGRYRCYKGSRNSKKSYDLIGLEVLQKILMDERRNVVIVRETLNTHRYSTFTTLKMLINNPVKEDMSISLSRYFKINKTDMTITYIPTGQVILFRGFDDPQKLQGIRVEHGYLTDVYVEEAYEIDDYEQWRIFDGSIRGVLPEGLFHQITFCFNAWNKSHWLYDHFFKGRLEDDFEYLDTHRFMDFKDENLVIDYGIGLYLHTSTYKINEFRDKKVYDVAMQELKRVALEYYKVEGLGMWGHTSGQTYLYWNDSLKIPHSDAVKIPLSSFTIGIDIGMGNGEGKPVKNTKDAPNRVKSAMTMSLIGVDSEYSRIITFDEFFFSNQNEVVKKGSPEVAEMMIKKIIEWINIYYDHSVLMKGLIVCYVDSADSGGFRTLLQAKAQELGVMNIRFMASTKNKIQTRVDFVNLLMAYGEYLITDRCVNLEREIKNAHEAEDGRCREDIDDHMINANEYAWIPLLPKIKRYKNFKEH